MSELLRDPSRPPPADRPGQFREDLFFRLNVADPAAALARAARRHPDLVQYFLTVAAREGLPQKTLSQGAIERMMEHRWPGNIRELENLIRQVAVHPGEEISAQVIEEELNSAFPRHGPPTRSRHPDAVGIRRRLSQPLFRPHAPACRRPGFISECCASSSCR